MSAFTDKSANAPSAEVEQSEVSPASISAQVIARASARRLTPEQLRAAANVLARIHSDPKRSKHVR